MTTPKQLIDRLREEFNCSIREERVIAMINALEARLAKDVICKTDILKAALNKGENRIRLDFPAEMVLRLSLSGKELRKSSVSEPCGFRCEGNDIVFDFACDSGEVVMEYLVMPQPFTQSDYDKRSLLLEDGYIEIYIYHILSREALLSDDIERLNNYSTIYAEALKALMLANRNSFSGAVRYLNVW